MPRTGQPATRQVEAVQRAITVLDALADAGADIGTNEIARRTGINISTISRLLSTLTGAGLAQYLPSSGRYRLGVRILQLASAARDSLDIRTLARPYLEELTDITSETSTLSIPGEHEVMTLDFVQSSLSVRSVAQIGRNSSPHATAVGKMFLACGGDVRDETLVAFTVRTIVDPGALDAEVERSRQRGWAQAVGEREEDLNGVAVPVLDEHAQLIAILGVQGPAGRFGQQAMQAAVEPLLERATLLASAV